MSAPECQDWQDRLIAAAATVTTGPRSTSEPVRLERLPQWLNLDDTFDVEDAEARFGLARQGREMIPALAAWKRKVVLSLEWADRQSEGHDFGDDALDHFHAFTGVSALMDVLLEIGSVGGDDESAKADAPSRERLDAYAAELDEPGR